MRILITGGTGLVGRRLVADRLERGDDVIVVSRSAARAVDRFAGTARPVEIVEGDVTEAGPWQQAVDGCDAVVHLAGAGIADERWTEARKRELVTSRVDSTLALVDAIGTADSRPGVLVSASAIGWYGDTGDDAVDERAPAAEHDFLGDLCVRWESAAAEAEAHGARTACVRTGLVLDARGGLLGSLVTPFRWFVGGPIGRGRAYMSWIHWRDLIGIYGLALEHADARGPINGTAPEPVTNRAFSRALARAIGRPSWLPVPPPALHLVLGEFAHYALMSQRVVPARAVELGYRFVHADVKAAMSAAFDEPASS